METPLAHMLKMLESDVNQVCELTAMFYYHVLFPVILGCTEGDIRLLEGPSRREGRVEVCRNNMWGSVCDDGFGTDDARVICRQLDFSTSGRTYQFINSDH